MNKKLKNLLNKRFYNNYDDNLIDSYLKARLFLYRQLEIYSVWPFVIKDMLTQLDDPQELVDRIPSLSSSVEAYKKQIINKWSKLHADLPNNFKEHKEILENLENAISDTIALHQDQTNEDEVGYDDE
ncbi:hypothetical protein [Bacillus sp. m3-13]|uniref:hypothetical protein n=1 Tax=Bacillus sp. m3-13 TaxID=406124 RepID=UPI0001E89DA6|nr:hypothetical protein [Bacillus sp. m3-13]